MRVVSERVADLLKRRDAGASVTVKGWVRTRRDSKAGFSFLDINDGSSLKGIQVVADNSLPNYEAVKGLSVGASVRVEGTLVESQGQGQAVEIKATSLHIFGTSDADAYPIQKKQTTLEFLRGVAHLRPRTNTIGAVMRIRNRLAFAVHQFFQSRGFMYVHTPIITAADCEGAGELFHVTTFDPAKCPKNDKGSTDWSKDFFGKMTHLTVSGQLEGEAYATAFTNIYTFGPTFRADPSNTSRHLAEFWMIEPEMAFCDLAGDMEIAQDFIKETLKSVLEHHQDDLAFLAERYDKELIARLEHVVTSPFEHVPYTRAIETLEKSGHKFEYPVKWGMDMQSEHERFLTEQVFKKPVIVTNYPRSLKPFYMKVDPVGADGRATVSAMDILVPGIGEIVGGSQREDQLDVLIDRMKEQGLKPEDLSWYLDLRRYGTVPHAGFGLGFERLVLFATAMGNIRDVIPFPRTPGYAEF